MWQALHERPAISLARNMYAPHGEGSGVERVSSGQPQPRSALLNHGNDKRKAQTPASVSRVAGALAGSAPRSCPLTSVGFLSSVEGPREVRSSARQQVTRESIEAVQVSDGRSLRSAEQDLEERLEKLEITLAAVSRAPTQDS